MPFEKIFEANAGKSAADAGTGRDRKTKQRGDGRMLRMLSRN